MNEKEILKFWEKNKIFQKSLQQAQGKPLFSFYDGPPFLSGKPHYGHILTATIKDTVARYKTMKGFNVPRRVGWDCHGLPVENFIEKELNVKSKKEIEEKIGIEKFNKAARDSVFSCLEIFQKTLKRVGRWADYTDSYMTLDNSYIESVWWVLKQLWERGLVYKDYRVSPYCPRCGTPLSNFEVNLGYKDVSDPSIYIKFKIKNKENAYFLVWTTTPWTLTANVALAIGNDIDYVKIKYNNNNL
ncbi:class I tRNA ligase family protein, partial [Patescibacteria group bacterium]|nr:class I tRNA ligase family protein [Patescibacteria group bacterium]